MKLILVRSYVVTFVDLLSLIYGCSAAGSTKKYRSMLYTLFERHRYAREVRRVHAKHMLGTTGAKLFKYHGNSFKEITLILMWFLLITVSFIF